MFLVGLTGGIASGKSTISNMLERLGAEVIDADLVAREVVAPGTEGLKQVVATFGEKILNADGTLSREALAEQIFSDPKQRHALDSILHPLIRERTMQHIAASRSAVVVYVVPLLVEANVDYPFDMVITIEAGTETQVKRLVESRGLSRDQALSRVSAQANEAQRVARADVRLDGSLPLPQLEAEVSKLWESIKLQAYEKAAHGKN
jgi:dephospho-CoA kinase